MLASTVAGVVAVALLAGCDLASGDTTARSATADEPVPLRVETSYARSRGVPVDHVLRVRAVSGALRSVTVRSSAGPLRGRLRGGTWRATGRLEPGTTYTVTSVGQRGDGATRRRTTRFRTVDLSLDQQTYAAIAPLDGETVGVGMPVIVTFDVPVSDRAVFERHMAVTSTPRQRGSWHWISGQEVHWRPATYWQAGTDVTVDLDINSLPAGNGIYGQESRSIDFHVGDSVVSKVNAATHRMQTFVNGSLARTMDITTGKPGFTTRSGVKVVIEKFAEKRMASETIGIADEDDPEFYDIEDVKWAMRVTYSGEFLHAAPWSVGSQGHANVSHGCTGMSPADAAWLYSITRRGDVVEYTGTDRPMTLTNGFGDWNLSFADYREGSALS